MADRQTRTPEDRAQEALGIAERREAKSKAKLEAAVQLQQTAKAQHDADVAALRYAGQNPALPEEVRRQFTEEPAPLTDGPEAEQGGEE